MALLRIRTSPSAMLAMEIVSVALLALAMAAYPGGTQWRHAADGHDFWRNYLCDLARRVALNGTPNPVGSALAQASMLALALGLVPFWRLLPDFFGARPRLGTWVRVLGQVAVAASFAVVLLPADRFSEVHGLAIVVAGVPGLFAALLAVVGLAGEERSPRVVASVGVTALLVAAAAFAVYLRQFFVPGPGPVAGAILERLALILLLVWMGAVAFRAPHSAEPREIG